MSSTNARTLFVGALTLDTLYRVDDFSRGPGKYLTTNAMRTASGMAANAATAAARLGGHPSLWASVGQDGQGAALIKEIEAEGVSCGFVRRVPGGRTASATIVVDQTGERWVLIDYDPVTQSVPTPDEIPSLEGYSAVMADVRWPQAACAMLRAAREAGLFAVLDADVAPVEVLQSLAQVATHIVASAEGAKILSGHSDVEAAAHEVARLHNCFVCVTNGEQGAFWVDVKSSNAGRIASPCVNVVDTNGAGDVFHGAFTQALAERAGNIKAIQFASAAAALKCTVLGGRLGAPNRDRTLTLMEENYNASL